MSAPYYQDSQVTLYHGDCREITEWLAADVLVTDPPYGIAWESGAFHSERSVRRTATQSIVGDEDTTVRDTALTMWGERPAIVFGSWRKPRPQGTRHRLIWHKKGKHPGVSPHPILPVDEEIYLIGDGWRGRTPTVLETREQRSREPARWGHPTPKPVALMETLIYACPSGVIADPFAGSGATLVAARGLGCRAIGVELEEAHCETIAKRLAQDCLPL